MRRLGFLIAALMLLQTLAACDGAPSNAPADAIGERLTGTWLREYEESGVRVRRVLVLDGDGTFREMSSVRQAQPDGPPSLSTASGEWVFDGTNLKRHYRLINNKPLSAPNYPFATFEIRFPDRTHFVGLDRVRRIEVTYQRVAEGTQP